MFGIAALALLARNDRGTGTLAMTRGGNAVYFMLSLTIASVSLSA